MFKNCLYLRKTLAYCGLRKKMLQFEAKAKINQLFNKMDNTTTVA